ncbi:HIRAN domain-containing protein [Sphingomonas hylomeconis]|nr:HIRAN domain-containing protein [Sphingomonas hylomeconis]
MVGRELTLAVVGIEYPNADRARSNRRFEIELCAPGDPVELRREPKNVHDRFAVAVFSERGIQMGYLLPNARRGSARSLERARNGRPNSRG